MRSWMENFVTMLIKDKKFGYVIFFILFFIFLFYYLDMLYFVYYSLPTLLYIILVSWFKVVRTSLMIDCYKYIIICIKILKAFYPWQHKLF